MGYFHPESTLNKDLFSEFGLDSGPGRYCDAVNGSGFGLYPTYQKLTIEMHFDRSVHLPKVYENRPNGGLPESLWTVVSNDGFDFTRFSSTIRGDVKICCAWLEKTPRRFFSPLGISPSSMHFYGTIELER